MANDSPSEQPGARRSDARMRELRSKALLGVNELAVRLGTSERFVRRLVCERRVPFHKVGKYVRFDPKDIDEWLAESRVEPFR